MAPAADLMVRLASYAIRFETMRTHANYAVEGRLETLDRRGRPDSLRQMKARVEADGRRAKLVVIEYTDGGKDKTDDARRRTRERSEKHKPGAGRKAFRMPLLAEEQPRYLFDQLQIDAIDPTRLRIGFVPRVREDDTLEGSAWVDVRAGTLISAAFELSKPPLGVDYLRFRAEFGAATELGPAPSTVLVEGKGGVLVFRKRFRGALTLSDHRIAS
jgi:hypothetical protein